jgi:hypothetical protein
MPTELDPDKILCFMRGHPKAFLITAITVATYFQSSNILALMAITRHDLNPSSSSSHY